jgi:hypothetical protein
VPNAKSKVLIIDASVARSAGISENPVSSSTRRFLYAVLEICHRMALTPAIRDEWSRHQSKFAQRWRLAMYAKKKTVVLEAREDAGLRARILGTSRTNEQSHAMLKDMPLVEAALQTDHIVVSRDEDARAFFQIRELSTITWVNPVAEPERVLQWMEQGAPAVDEWRLGRR